MWVNVKFIDGSKKPLKLYASKTMLVEVFRNNVAEKWDIPVKSFKLFLRGKVLVDSYKEDDGNVTKTTLFDYNVNVNDTVQLMMVQEDSKESSSVSANEEKETPGTSVVKVNKVAGSPNKNVESVPSNFFKVGELVDAKNEYFDGAWMEAKIVGIRRDENAPSETPDDSKNNSLNQSDDDENSIVIPRPVLQASSLKYGDGLLYALEFEDFSRSTVPLKAVRPRARKKVSFQDVKIGMKLMVNYNTDEPNKVGYWFDCQVTDISNKRTRRRIIGTIFIGLEETTLHEQEIKYVDDMYEIERTLTIRARDDSQKKLMMLGPDVKRMRRPACDHCNDKPNVTCRECSCLYCGGKDEPEKQIICDECQKFFHLECLDPPLDDIPEDDWYCPTCKNDDEIVTPGQRIKSKRKSKMPSSDSSRDWGRGMACAGRIKECTIVEKNHFGPIPGVEVGMSWQYRNMVAGAGIHRPMVAGIHGREEEGAYSIVLSGGYEDDTDNGDEFFYTGSGGRDLKGNKRTAAQSFDQSLTKMNRALARNCAATLNASDGAEAKDWTKGKPIRVVRGFKGRKHSTYCPVKGFRYDGIYKVIKYWPETGMSGFIVWRYLLRRDDAVPAPWTDEGKKRIEDLGLVMELMEGAECEDFDTETITTKKRRNQSPIIPKPKKPKKDSNGDRGITKAYELPQICYAVLVEDELNKKIWDRCLETLKDGRVKFLEKVSEEFKCVVCQDIVAHPVTLECGHNFCKSCLKRSFENELYQCPMCRFPLEKDYEITINEYLKEVLNVLFKWYDVER